MSDRPNPPIDPRAILPPDRELVRTFIDGATGYHVIEHVGVGEFGHDLGHVTLVDPRTGEVVPIERRAAEIPPCEQIRIDEVHGLRLSTRHTIDLRTGLETLDEVLTDLRTGAELSKGRSIALRRADDTADLITAHLESLAAQRREEAFWRDEYPQWSFDRRATYWYDNIRRRMRWQEEFGLDELAMFTPEVYADWHAREPDIDRILDAVALRLERPGLRAEFDRRIGRASPPQRKRRATTSRGRGSRRVSPKR